MNEHWEVLAPTGKAGMKVFCFEGREVKERNKMCISKIKPHRSKGISAALKENSCPYLNLRQGVWVPIPTTQPVPSLQLHCDRVKKENLHTTHLLTGEGVGGEPEMMLKQLHEYMAMRVVI